MFSPSEEALLLECLNDKIQEVAGFNTEAFQYFLMVGTFLPGGGGPGGEVGAGWGGGMFVQRPDACVWSDAGR